MEHVHVTNGEVLHSLCKWATPTVFGTFSSVLRKGAASGTKWPLLHEGLKWLAIASSLEAIAMAIASSLEAPQVTGGSPEGPSTPSRWFMNELLLYVD